MGPRHLSASPFMIFTTTAGVTACWWMSLVAPWTSFAAPPLSAPNNASLNNAQVALEQKRYAEALTILEGLSADRAIWPEARRVKIRSLLGLSRPPDALREYEQLEAQTKQDDHLLR
ncbi:MAG: hypothetical protein ACT4OO_07430, partial [Nitrospiraceae bacterium]